MKKISAILKEVLADLAKFKNKSLDAALLGVVIAAVAPFGLNLGPYGEKIIAVLAAVGVIAALLEKAISKK